MLVKYSSNNSGGRWWLEDKDWHALEAAGWKVDWVRLNKKSWLLDADGERSLGALATEAEKEFETPGEAMREFEKVTGQTVSDEGCNCCGAPHSFSWSAGAMDFASGEECLQYMYSNVPRSLRDGCTGKID